MISAVSQWSDSEIASARSGRSAAAFSTPRITNSKWAMSYSSLSSIIKNAF